MNYKIISLFFVCLMITGCHHLENKQMIGMPNPASVYCAQLHGKSVIVDTSQGQYANCNLPNGEIIEEWALYRRDHSESK